MGNKILILVFILVSSTAFAQSSKVVRGQDNVEEATKKHLDEYIQTPSFQKFLKKYNISGSYTLEFSIMHKGQVVHVRPNGRGNDASIPGQNSLKDHMIDYKFPFKLAKGTKHKVSYTFENL